MGYGDNFLDGESLGIPDDVQQQAGMWRPRRSIFDTMLRARNIDPGFDHPFSGPDPDPGMSPRDPGMSTQPSLKQRMLGAVASFLPHRATAAAPADAGYNAETEDGMQGDRIDDDPAQRPHAGMTGTPEYGPQPDHLTELEDEYQRLGVEPQAQPKSLKQKILGGIGTFLTPPAIRNQEYRDQQQRNFEQQQNLSLRERILPEIEAERRLQETMRHDDQQAENANLGKTVTLAGHVRMWNPQTRSYDTDLGPADSGKPDTMDSSEGPLQYNRQTGQWERISVGGQPVGPKQGKPDSPEQQYIDEYQRTHKGASLAQAVRAYNQDTQKPQQQLVIGPDNKVIELKPGMTVPQGSMSATAELGKPSADEQRRADLAENMEENLNSLEDIAKRRPELFGSVHGRITQLRQFAGTSDPDVARLKAIREYLGMASVGAHSMRNAQHVGEAADAVMAGFNNSPEATISAINIARQSLQTFKNDIARGNNPRAAQAAQPPQSPSPKKGSAGAKLKDRVSGKVLVEGKDF